MECEWRNPHSFKLTSTKLTAPRVPPFQVSLGATELATEHGHLKPNDYTLVLRSGRTVKQRLEFRVRDSSYYITQRSLGYEGEMVHVAEETLWPVTAVTRDEIPDEYVQGSFDNMTPTRPSCRRPRCPRSRAGSPRRGRCFPSAATNCPPHRTSPAWSRASTR